MIESNPEEVLKQICEKIGYGRVMQIASNEWSAKARNEGREGEGLSIGPHKSFTVYCGCIADGNHCDWCAGSGWLTSKVKQLKDSNI